MHTSYTYIVCEVGICLFFKIKDCWRLSSFFCGKYLHKEYSADLSRVGIALFWGLIEGKEGSWFVDNAPVLFISCHLSLNT